jgi:hypothetical protein
VSAATSTDDLGSIPPIVKSPQAPIGSPSSASLGLIDQLLRDRDGMIARIRKGAELATIMRTMIATIAICCAMVGAALGSYRGGVQIGYAAIKLPLVLLGTAALSAPALTAIGAACGRRARSISNITARSSRWSRCSASRAWPRCAW